MLSAYHKIECKELSIAFGWHVIHWNLTSEKWQGIVFYGDISNFGKLLCRVRPLVEIITRSGFALDHVPCAALLYTNTLVLIICASLHTKTIMSWIWPRGVFRGSKFYDAMCISVSFVNFVMQPTRWSSIRIFGKIWVSTIN